MVKTNKNLLFISDTSPNRKMASSVIFHRHLSRLTEEGWGIHLLLSDHDRKNYEGNSEWKTNFLGIRKWYYPPFRPFGILSSIRFSLMASDASAFIKQADPDVIIGYLRGSYFSGLAALIAQRYEIPLGYLYHDATEYFPDLYGNAKVTKQFLEYKKKLIRSSAAVWAISESMIHDEGSPKNMKLLYPLSEELHLQSYPSWKTEFHRSPVIFHAGTVYHEIIDPLIAVARSLALMGGKLILMTASSNCARVVAESVPAAVQVVDPRPAADAVSYIAENAAGMIIAYPESVHKMPWIKTCFPSKFPQFLATGLPTMILAPRGSALADWAELEHYHGVVDMATPDEMSKQILNLMNESSWNQAAQQSRRLWNGLFHPANIHHAFHDGLQEIIQSVAKKH